MAAIGNRNAAGKHTLIAPRHGVNNNHHTLTEREVLEIRSSSRNCTVLGKLFGVHRVTIWRIKAKQLWSHL